MGSARLRAILHPFWDAQSVEQGAHITVVRYDGCPGSDSIHALGFHARRSFIMHRRSQAVHIDSLSSSAGKPLDGVDGQKVGGGYSAGGMSVNKETVSFVIDRIFLAPGRGHVRRTGLDVG